jgi:hypothetical protein
VQAEGRELISYIKLRRAFHLLAKVLGSSHDPKNQNKIEAEIKTFRKRFNELEALVEKNGIKEEIPEKVFSELLPKTLRCNYGLKNVNPITLK